MRHYLCLVALLLVACVNESRPPADAEAAPKKQSRPVFETETWPGEGRPVIEAVRPNLVLVQAPYHGAPLVATVAVDGGQQLEYDSTRFQTVDAVKLHVRAAGTIIGRNLGPIRYLSLSQYYSHAIRESTIAVTPASTVELLQHRAEGFCFVRVLTDVVDVPVCPTFDTTTFVTPGQPQTRWWIYVRVKEIAGWLELSDTTAKDVRRLF